MIGIRVRRGLVALTAASLLLAGCGGYDDTPVPQAEETTDTPPGNDGPPPCEDPKATRSYAPGGSVASLRSTDDVQAIRDSGRLVAGVSADQFLMGFRNPLSGKIEGFDIDMATRIADEIFGEPGHLVLKVITPAQRFDFLGADGKPQQVDIVARNMTINCDRWKLIAFSQEYYHSGQKVLVAKNSGIKSVADLDGKRVCAPEGTTSLDNIKTIAPKAIAVSVENDSECLVLFQNAQVDALSTDDTVLAGLAKQDPYATVLSGDALTDEPYGIGTNKGSTDLVRFINALLEEMRDDGSWQRSFDKWLGPALNVKGAKPITQPPPVYGR